MPPTKKSPIDLQQRVTELRVYERPLNSSSGEAFHSVGFPHTLVVVTVTSGQLYLIEKCPGSNNDLDDRPQCRSGKSRIVQLQKNDLDTFEFVKQVTVNKEGVTLEKLLDCCGVGYGVVDDNCWNGVERMTAAVNKEAEGSWSWQGKAAAGVAVGIGVIGVISAIGAALGGKVADRRSSKEDRMQKY